MSDDRNHPFGRRESGLESSGIPGTGAGGISGLPGSGPPRPSQPEPAARPSLDKPSLQKPVFTVPEPPQPMAGQAAMVLAGWGVRFGASVLDGFILAAAAFVIPLVGFLVVADHPFSTADVDGDGSNLASMFGLWVLLYIVAWLFYWPVTMVRNEGATWGKKMVGIRVVTEAGVPPTFGRAFLREIVFKGVVVGVIGGTLFLPWLLSYLWPLWDEQSRAGHDFMAKTRVIQAS